MEEEQKEITAFDPGDAKQEMQQVAELRESIDSLVQTITEQVAKEEEEKLEASELQAKEELKAKKLAEEQAKLDAENDLLIEEQVQAHTATTVEFREDLLVDLKTLNESILELKEIELQNQELLNNAVPSVKQASDLAIIFLCLIPLFIVYKWLASMFNSAF